MKDRSSSIHDAAWFEQRDLFVGDFYGGKEGYHTCKIPALVVSKKGTLLAFCEGRKYTGRDADKIDILLKRSFDGGKSWQDTQIIVSDDDMTCGNPCPVVDQSTGTIWLPFCKNPRYDGPVPSDRRIVEGKDPRTVWITKSTDDGSTWAEPMEITKDVKDPSWTWYATGPGHGIQLKNGRLVIPCDHMVGKNFDERDPVHSHIIYSDDHGVSWKIGGIVDEGTNECTVVQTVDDSLYINCRNANHYRYNHHGEYKGNIHRVYKTLIEPICQASLVRFTDKDHYKKNRILFSNPANGKPGKREKLTVRISYDECRTWPVSKLLNKGPSAYSDLAIAPDMTILCLYERGKKFYSEKLTLARFNIEWLTDGADKLQPRI